MTFQAGCEPYRSLKETNKTYLIQQNPKNKVIVIKLKKLKAQSKMLQARTNISDQGNKNLKLNIIIKIKVITFLMIGLAKF